MQRELSLIGGRAFPRDDVEIGSNVGNRDNRSPNSAFDVCVFIRYEGEETFEKDEEDDGQSGTLEPALECT